MLLSQLIGKEIAVGNIPRGSVKGVGISLKTHDVKYLLCAGTTPSRALFAIPVNSVTSFGERLLLPRLRPTFPKHCACLFLHLPVYSYYGEHLGNLQEVTLHSFIATTLRTDKGFTLPISAVTACSDAILLKREQLFPLGQRVPAPILSTVSGKKEGVVTKPVLHAAIKQNALIKLTLSLPPFSIETL